MSFDLPHFLPYLLNRAADAASEEFQAHYRSRFGMLRTEWRVLFHLGCYGDMTAKQICDASSIHKTKVSRAVRALERKRFVTRRTDTSDRRNEWLSLTRGGTAVFRELSKAAETYEARLLSDFDAEDRIRLRRALMKLANMPDTTSSDLANARKTG